MSDALLTTEDGVRRVQEALREAELDGWLLYEFHGNNPIAAALLGLGVTRRRGFALIPARGEPVALIHAIEHSSWRQWPWSTESYAGWREMEATLGSMLEGRKRVAMEVSPGAAVPTVDYVSMGTAQLVGALGVELESSAGLVTRFHSVWSARQREDHRRAAEIIAAVAEAAFHRAADAIRDGEPTTEGALSDWIRGRFAEEGLVHEADCIVAIGRTASDPHYAPAGAGEVIGRGQLLLIDLWAGFENTVPADQTWMGIMAPSVGARTQEIWAAVKDARNEAVTFLEERHEDGGEVRGCEVDDVAREVIRERGYGEYFVHRTGHSIDIGLHGSGPNLDNLETRDDRLLIPGVGFSIEPGIYVPDDIGVRSEINVHWTADGPEVTPERIQEEIFLLLDD